MDTLVIVRKIRQAEALADAGNHGEARRTLQPLLSEDGLSEAHRTLIQKKIELFERQRERMTRVMSRSGSTIMPPVSDDSSERTAIRKPLASPNATPTSDLTTIRKAVPDATERPTDVPLDKAAQSNPTEVVPRLHRPGVSDTGRRDSLPTVKTEVPATQPPSQPAQHAGDATVQVPRLPPRSTGNTTLHSPRPGASESGHWSAITTPEAPARRPDPNDSQELAPVMDDLGMDGDDELSDATSEGDPRHTDIFSAPGTEPGRRPASSPEISRAQTDIPASPRDTPIPAPSDSQRVKVRDSVIMPQAQVPVLTPVPRPAPVIPEPAPRPSIDEDSTYLLADEHFTRAPSSRSSPRSNPELKALADRLPDDDLRRELAMEVVRLREELAKSGRTPETRPTERTQRDRPASGSFHIPASQVNTIVRRAAGTDSIEVHMPGRDDASPELAVLRRDSVRGKAAGGTPTDRIALAQDYIDASNVSKPGLLKPLATWTGVAVILAVLGWGVLLAYESIAGAAGGKSVLTEDGLDDLKLGQDRRNDSEFSGKDAYGKRQLASLSRHCIVQYDAADRITAIVLPGPGIAADKGRRFEATKVRFGSAELDLGKGSSIRVVAAALGESTPPLRESALNEVQPITLRFESRQGHRALEFHYLAGQWERPHYVRVLDTAANPPAPQVAGE